jgi:hypothetical protein
MTALIHVILLISVYILYLALKYRYTECPPIAISNPETEQTKPIKVSEIFSKMFQDASPVPGTI